jgi:hypothetical protein
MKVIKEGLRGEFQLSSRSSLYLAREKKEEDNPSRLKTP